MRRFQCLLIVESRPGRVNINDQKMPNLAQVTLAQWEATGLACDGSRVQARPES
jgi:hypothetical protein